MEVFDMLFIVFLIILICGVFVLANENKRLKGNIETQNKALNGMEKTCEKQALIIKNYEVEND